MSGNRPRTIEQRTQLYEEAAAIVERSRGIDLTMEALALRVAASPRHLQRAYAEIGQTTFRAQLLRVRMRRAAELLGQSGQPIGAIADELGYSSQSQFSKIFRRYWGVSPSAARTDGVPATAPRERSGR